MDYEKLRNEITAGLAGQIPEDMLRTVLSVIDLAAAHYDITQACTDLSVPADDVPQIVKMHIATLAIENRSRNTLDIRLRILKAFFRDVRKPYDQITANDIRAYLFQYKKQRSVSDSTLDRIRCNITCFFTWCVNEEYIARNPAAKICAIKYQSAERKAMTQLQLETIRSACQTLREKAIVDFLYSTGCRASEMCNVEITDIDLDNQTVQIRHGKGDKHRVTYLNAESVISLRAYLKSRTDDCKYVFVSERKPAHGITKDALSRIINKIVARTTLRIHVHPHLFRHTAATIALQAGMPVEQVQRFLGHAKLDTTMIYAKTDDRDVQANHRRCIA